MNLLASLPPALVVSTCQGSAAILGVLLLRKPVRRWPGSRAAHLLWLVVLTQTGVAWLPPLPPAWRAPWPKVETSFAESPSRAVIRVLAGKWESSKLQATDSEKVAPAEKPPAWPEIVWLAGVVLAMGVSAAWACQASLLVRHGRFVPMATYPEILAGLRIRPGRVRFCETSKVRSPALCGLWRPVILLPADWRQQFSTEEMRCVVAHEIAHLRRCDLWWSWAFLLLRAVYWFNPLVWAAAHFQRIDQELACDQWATAGSSSADVQTYGEALLKAARLFGRPGIASPAYVTMAQGKAALAERLRRLGHHPPPGRLASLAIAGVAMAAAVILGPLRGEAEPAVARPPGAASISAQPLSTPAAEPFSKAPEIEIETRFIETSGELDLSNPHQPAHSSTGLSGTANVYSEADLQGLLKHLNEQKGVDLLSAPRVTTHSGQRAKIEVTREFRFPIAFEPHRSAAGKAISATPTDFDSRNVGVTLDVTPEVAPGNTIDLILAPTVVEFTGFINYGAGKPARGPGSDALDEMMRSEPLTGTDQVLNQPVFDTRSITSSGSIHSGQTLMLGAFTHQDAQIVETGAPGHRTRTTQKVTRQLFIMVTARILGVKDRPAGS